MLELDDLPMFLARRDTRLKYWSKNFSSENLSLEDLTEAREQLQTYALLLVKLEKDPQAADAEETYQRIVSLDRTLTALFERSRLVTARFSN